MLEILPRLGAIRVLLIEDHADFAFVLQKSIERAGFETVCGSTCVEARNLIKENSFHVLVSDIALPDGTGWDIVEFWKSHCDRPAIAISAYFSSATTALSQPGGFDRCLSKPFDLVVLITSIYELVGGSDVFPLAP